MSSIPHHIFSCLLFFMIFLWRLILIIFLCFLFITIFLCLLFLTLFLCLLFLVIFLWFLFLMIVICLLFLTAAFHARVRGSVPGLGGLKETKMFLPHPRVKVSIVGSLRDREVACSSSDRQGSNFESCVWRTVSSQSSHHPQEVLLAQFSLYVHKGGLNPDSFHFISFFTTSISHNFLLVTISHDILTAYIFHDILMSSISQYIFITSISHDILVLHFS